MKRQRCRVWLISFPGSQSNGFSCHSADGESLTDEHWCQVKYFTMRYKWVFRIISGLYNKDHLVIIKRLLVGIRPCGEHTVFFSFLLCVYVCSCLRARDFVLYGSHHLLCLCGITCLNRDHGGLEVRRNLLCLGLNVEIIAKSTMTLFSSSSSRIFRGSSYKSHPDSAEPPSCFTLRCVNTKFSDRVSFVPLAFFSPPPDPQKYKGNIVTLLQIIQISPVLPV